MIFKPPQNISHRDHSKPSVFLAGSIEMGKAEDWQGRLAQFFLSKGYNVFNPRREDWDASWIQSYENPDFYQQVTWELNALNNSDVIVMYLLPDTISPISLLELGLFVASKKMRVVCPEGYFRKGNVEVVCDLYNIPLYASLEKMIKDFEDGTLSNTEVR